MTYAIVLRVDVEETGLLDVVTRGVFGETGDVDDAEAGRVVRLVGETIKCL